MELFAAQNKPQMEAIRTWIEESDILCLILGARYGSIEPVTNKSYVECEYDYAMLSLAAQIRLKLAIPAALSQVLTPHQGA